MVAVASPLGSLTPHAFKKRFLLQVLQLGQELGPYNNALALHRQRFVTSSVPPGPCLSESAALGKTALLERRRREEGRSCFYPRSPPLCQEGASRRVGEPLLEAAEGW